MVPQQTLNTIFEKLGNVEAVAREAKHASNNTSAKIDAVAGKVDALALVVATQGHLREDVERLEQIVKDQAQSIEVLNIDKHRREGAVGLVEWIAKHWPFALVAAFLGAVVVWANGRLGI